MQHSSFNTLFPSISNLTAVRDAVAAPQKIRGDRYLWELLHHSDHHESNTQQIAKEGLDELSRENTILSAEPLSIGSPDWVFVCGQWDPALNSALIFRDKVLVAAIQKSAGQLKLCTFNFLSARLVEALFELGVDARAENGIGELFWKRVETVAWRHGLGTLGYTLESFSSQVSEPSELDEKSERLRQLSISALPNSFAARQLRILYKYG